MRSLTMDSLFNQMLISKRVSIEMHNRVWCFPFYICWCKITIQQIGLEHGLFPHIDKIEWTLVTEADKSSQQKNGIKS